ncbi:hypothetical protein BJF85_20135 [Saccharomonospora sp. CUA-673]|uniref:hypothetical protein n=1 Tax=Saccharomonospora sp. CUA-673 TaxID=1904969 RepID=UPI0009619724|nr:hypothetical protein [Saccharomonospora sp. CUA-673]OLT44193.1 hypothetical protein BJF85_20135 [Saccharomonospora sp. CUA-673]
MSTAGRLAAKAGGADIPTESFMFDVVGLGASGMPYGGGLFNAGFQAGAEVAARTQGEDAGTAWGRIPFGGRWWSDLDDASALDEAGQAERDQQRAQERVWE